MSFTVRQAVMGFAVMLFLALAASGCERKPRFVPTDGSGSAVTDSSALKLRALLEKWDAGLYEEAAEVSAAVLEADLSGRPPATWRGRASQLLDSLSIGAEVAGGPCAIAVNFFARSDPGAGSWPYVLWCDGDRASSQRIQGSGLRLASAVTRGFEGQSSTAGRPGLAALYTMRGGGGHRPVLMTWDLRGDKWQRMQILGADSLGGAGTGEFEVLDNGSITLTTRTYRSAPYFEECPSCPHVYMVRRFHWGVAGFNRTYQQSVPSTYATFVSFVQAMMSSDWNGAATRVTHRSLLDAANRFDWGRPQGSWRVAPVSERVDDELVMFRGQDEAYRVHFEPWGRDWLISGFEPVPRSID